MGVFFGFSIFRFFFKRLLPKQPQQSQNRSTQRQSASQSAKKKKIISRNEGEYVDFVEIKDQNSTTAGQR
ncbi:MAG: DUF4834 family protein [Dysgonamonadaceae bacterium]|nr:DUF4834 family protein [Dysgonamonadaceae bacterium]